MLNSSVMLDSKLAAESALKALRETIFWEIAYETARHCDLEEIFPSMKETAESAVNATSATIFCDDRVVEEIRFGDQDDLDRQLVMLHHLQRVLHSRVCWYEDNCPDDGIAGFCWPLCGNQYRLIFK